MINVKTSNNIANELNSNMTETSASVQQIISNINSIRDEMTNQSAGVEEATTASQEVQKFKL